MEKWCLVVVLLWQREDRGLRSGSVARTWAVAVYRESDGGRDEGVGVVAGVALGVDSGS